MPVKRTSPLSDEDLAREVRKRARRAGTSPAVWVEMTLSQRKKLVAMRRATAAYQAEFGAFTKDELEAVKKWMDTPSMQERSSRRNGGTAGSGRSRTKRRARVAS